jgi:diaminopimelate decarboxylase
VTAFTTNAAGHPEVDGCDAVDLAHEFGTPLWVISAARIRENHRRLRDAFARAYPDARIVYASKANPEPAVLRVTRGEGSLVDAVTMGHLRLCLEAGYDPGDIVFNGNAKTHEELRFALERGIGVINADSLEEVEAIAALQPRDARPQRVCLRLAVDNRRHVGDDPEFRKWEWLGKFGMDEADALDAATVVRDHPGLELAGIHSHVGFTAYGLDYSAELDLRRHRRAVEQVLDLVEALAARDLPVRILNFGGGFRVGNPEGFGPGKLTDFPSADDYAAAIAGPVEDACATAGWERPQILLEAGGYLVADAAALLATVGYTKTRRADDETRQWAFLENTGGYHLVRRLMFGFYHRTVAASRMHDEPSARVSVAGPACADDDVCVDEPLPALTRGDLVAVLDAGAYCESVTSDYCAVPIPAAVIVDDGKAEISRRRETVDDIAARFRVPDFLDRTTATAPAR